MTTYMLNARLWLPDGDDIPPPSVIKRSAYFGRIIKAASIRPEGKAYPTGVRCDRRPGKKRCNGTIGAARNGDIIQWACIKCEYQGAIAEWKETPWDLSNLGVPDPGGEKKPVLLSFEEYELLHDMITSNPEVDVLIAGGIATELGVFIEGDAGRLEMLAEDLAFNANHEQNRKQQRMYDTMCDTVGWVLSHIRT